MTLATLKIWRLFLPGALIVVYPSGKPYAAVRKSPIRPSVATLLITGSDDRAGRK